jgi:outer membrane protein assembly factor BamB
VDRLLRGRHGPAGTRGWPAYTTVDAGEPLGVLNAATGMVASSGRQFGGSDGGNVVVANGWIYLLVGDVIEAYSL